MKKILIMVFVLFLVGCQSKEDDLLSTHAKYAINYLAIQAENEIEVSEMLWIEVQAVVVENLKETYDVDKITAHAFFVTYQVIGSDFKYYAFISLYGGRIDNANLEDSRENLMMLYDEIVDQAEDQDFREDYFETFELKNGEFTEKEIESFTPETLDLSKEPKWLATEVSIELDELLIMDYVFYEIKVIKYDATQEDNYVLNFSGLEEYSLSIKLFDAQGRFLNALYSNNGDYLILPFEEETYYIVIYIYDLISSFELTLSYA